MNTKSNNDLTNPEAVTVGAGEPWEQKRLQSPTPEAVLAREQVKNGAELVRVVSKVDQAMDGAQSWSLASREAARNMGVEAYNKANGVAGPKADAAKPLEVPVLMTGRMPKHGTFVTTEALKEYDSQEKLPTIEIVAAPNTVESTGAYDLTTGPTYRSLFPAGLETSEPTREEARKQDTTPSALAREVAKASERFQEHSQAPCPGKGKAPDSPSR